MSTSNKFVWISLFVMGTLVCCKNSNSASDQQQSIDNSPQGMQLIPAGILEMGGDNPQADPSEYPKHKVKINAFYMDATEVTNADFEKFVNATYYKTLAERPLDWEELKKQLPPNTPKPPDSIMAPGALVFVPTDRPVQLNNPQRWWRWTIGANWRNPEGPDSDLTDRMDHPVVQIAWEDAMEYCKWAGKRLPTEAEWEWAARGGKENMIYPWGNESVNEGTPKANFYQGIFPYQNTNQDGYTATAPVKSFDANGYGLYDMSGNVWEWCADWYDVNYYQRKSANVSTASGPDKAYNPQMPYQQERVIRGGSFLCNDSYCSGYRNARRMGSTADTGLNHTGFRCVKSIH
ncbi:MAG: formylglycine-generating enzyme family protein [Saprospiraceae bacterium]|nr:formylglycine-generating enzyme family protein [Saprospiraceae bacterium]